MQSKPGWQTTEFWLTMVIQFVGVLVLLGYIKPEQQKDVKDGIESVITSVVALIVQGAAIWKYIQSRTDVKSQ